MRIFCLHRAFKTYVHKTGHVSALGMHTVYYGTFKEPSNGMKNSLLTVRPEDLGVCTDECTAAMETGMAAMDAGCDDSEADFEMADNARQNSLGTRDFFCATDDQGNNCMGLLNQVALDVLGSGIWNCDNECILTFVAPDLCGTVCLSKLIEAAIKSPNMYVTVVGDTFWTIADDFIKMRDVTCPGLGFVTDTTTTTTSITTEEETTAEEETATTAEETTTEEEMTTTAEETNAEEETTTDNVYDDDEGATTTEQQVTSTTSKAETATVEAQGSGKSAGSVLKAGLLSVVGAMLAL